MCRTVVGIVDLQLDMSVVPIDAGRRQSRSSEDLGTSLRLRKGCDLQKGCFRVSGLMLGGDGTFLNECRVNKRKMQSTNKKSQSITTYSLL